MLQKCRRVLGSNGTIGKKIHLGGAAAAWNLDLASRHRAYRAKGSKNTSTLLKEAQEENGNATPLSREYKSQDAGRKKASKSARSGDITQAPRSSPRSKRNSRTPTTEGGDAKESIISIPPGSQHHNDLPSFLSYAARTGLSPTSTVYAGTHYEYIVAAALARLGFDLVRTGRHSDRGIDLVGTWRLPIPPPATPLPRSSLSPFFSSSSASTSSSEIDQARAPMKVILQCKAYQHHHSSTSRRNRSIGPSHIRELEGALSGAPPRFRGPHVLAFLVASAPGTKGLRDALTRSRVPMGFMYIDSGRRTSSPTTTTSIFTSTSRPSFISTPAATRDAMGDGMCGRVRAGTKGGGGGGGEGLPNINGQRESRTIGKESAEAKAKKTEAGKIYQILWNEKAVGWGLQGVGVTTRFTTASALDPPASPNHASPCVDTEEEDEVEEEDEQQQLQHEVGLTYNGRML